MKYSASERQHFRDAVIKAHKEGLSKAKIIESYSDIPSATIYRWIKEYEESGKTERITVYPASLEHAEIKKKVLSLYREGFNFSRIQEKVKVVSRTTVSRWIREFLANQAGDEIMNKSKKRRKENPGVQTSGSSDERCEGMTPKQLLAHYKQAQKQIEQQEIKIEIYETMIKIAEKEFGIAIRKKPGAK